MNYQDIDKLISDVHRGIITLDNLPENLYLDNAKKFEKALYQGYGFKLSELDKNSVRYQSLVKLRDNLYRFTGAKTFRNISELQSLRIDPVTGYLKTLKEYEVGARAVYDKFNNQWQQTEIDLTVGSSDMAAKYDLYKEEKEEFPLLRYQTANDPNVRDEHAALDGITLPVDDPFWDDFTPLNGWGCRCDVIQLSHGKATEFKPGELQEKTSVVKPLFKNNPSESKKIFKDDHPYFAVPENYNAQLSLNFGLPLPE